MNLPQPGDYINIHTHGTGSAEGVFIIDNLMAHEGRLPCNIKGVAYSCGIHPWFLNENNYEYLLSCVYTVRDSANLIAFGEAGFDKLKGPDMELQRRAFEAQVSVSEERKKPLVIHCVRAWEELFAMHKKLRPSMPWLIHGFRGNRLLAGQLLAKGMYLSFWFDFVIRPEATELLKSMPLNRIFLETDGAETEISAIYNKVAADLGISIVELKSVFYRNFIEFFNIQKR